MQSASGLFHTSSIWDKLEKMGRIYTTGRDDKQSSCDVMLIKYNRNEEAIVFYFIYIQK